MRNTTQHIAKSKVDPVITFEGQTYRSRHSLLLNGEPVTLAVLHVEPKSATGCRFFDINRCCNEALLEAETRYPKHGGSALIKAALVLNEKGEVTEKVALKCFFSHINCDMAPIEESALKEAAYWQSCGENAYVFTSAHPEVVQKVYLVMPWVNGYDLQQLCEDHATEYSIEDRIEILSQLFEVLQPFHQKGEVVSDLKLENVMYDFERKKIVLVDVSVVPAHTEAKVFTPDFLEMPKRLAYEGHMELPILDEKDVLYAFGELAHRFLMSSPYNHQEEIDLGFVISSRIKKIFCNPDREARPSVFDFQNFLKESESYQIYKHNPYPAVSGFGR